jgi:cardiolipin synthase
MTRILLKTIAVVAVITTAGLLIAQDQETIKLRSPVAADDPRAPAYVAALVGADLSAGNAYDVLVNGDEIFPAMLEAIERATRRISLETYVYQEGRMAEQFTAALERAARRGVRVNLVIDSVGASAMDDGHLERLREAGCEVVNFNPSAWYALEELNYRTHRKILVVDGEVGFTGGVGVADYWIGDARTTAEWRDTHVRIRGPIVRLLEATFFENFIEGQQVVAPHLSDPPDAPGTDAASLIVRSSPTGGSSDLKRLYLLMLAMSRRSLDITSPYFVTDESIDWAFEDAVRRGVRIRILVESDITDAKPVKYASRALYERLMALGIEIYEYQPTMMHAKVIVVDGVWSMFGSANFDNRSLELNDEMNIAVADRALAAKFTEDFEADLTRSRRLALEEWRKRPRIEKAREKFWSYFAEVF